MEAVAALFRLENQNEVEMEETTKKDISTIIIVIIIVVVFPIKKFLSIANFIRSRPKLQISNVWCFV